MRPEDKAKELFDFFNSVYSSTSIDEEVFKAKVCAIKCIDEIIKSNPYNINRWDVSSNKKFWNEVKQKIEKL